MATVYTLDQHLDLTGAKPRLVGRRITVQDIAVWHEQLGQSADEIATEYDLSLAQIYAALAYYFDHRSDFAQAMADRDALVASLRRENPSKLAAKLSNATD